jgi:hypothetical protein
VGGCNPLYGGSIPPSLSHLLSAFAAKLGVVAERLQPHVVAESDQLQAQFSMMASSLGVYFDGLQTSGFDRAEAFQLIQACQDAWVEDIFGPFN